MPDSVRREEWNIGIIDQTIEDIYRHGLRRPVRWYPKRSVYEALADPFCSLDADGNLSIFVERVNQWRNQGEIWSAVVKPGEDITSANFQVAVTGPSHLSYPFMIYDREQRYLVFESSEAGGLFLWKWDVSQEQWKYVKTILNRPAVDATLHFDGKYWWLFTTFVDDQPNERLYLYYSDSIEGTWKPHGNGPVKVDVSSSRPGGALFLVDGQLVRPAQDCSRTYGGGLVLNRVMTLTPDLFHEEPARVIEPASNYFCHGIHTIARAGNQTVVDGKRWLSITGNLLPVFTAKVTKMMRRRRSPHFLEKVTFSSASKQPG